MTNEELAQKIQNGEQDLITELWKKNQGVVNIRSRALFEKYRDRCISCAVEVDDIVQISFLALCDAVKAYKVDEGHKLLSYFKFPLLNHFHDLIGFRISKHDLLNRCKSLNESVGEDDDTMLIELLADPDSEEPSEVAIDNIFQSELREKLENALLKLSDNCATAIRGQYFEGETQEEIAAKIGVSRSYIGQLERQALRKLRQEHDLQLLHEEVISRLAYRGTGLTYFRENWESSVERAVIRTEEILNRKKERMSEKYSNYTPSEEVIDLMTGIDLELKELMI